jgi:hypothetical protein
MKIVQMPTHGGTILDGSVAVVSVGSAMEKITTTGLLQAALGGPGDASTVLVNVNGMTLPVSADFHQLIATCRNGRPVMFEITPGAGEMTLENPGEAALYSAVYLHQLLAEAEPGTPQPLGVAGRQRLSILREQKTGSVKIDDSSAKAIEEMEIWRQTMLSGYAAIDAAHEVMAEAEEAASKRFAGPSAFNRYVDLRDERDALVMRLGFADFDTFTRERNNLIASADERIRGLKNVPVNPTNSSAVEAGETTILEIHRDIDAKLGRGTSFGVETGSARAKNVLRHNLAAAASQILNGMGTDTTPDRAIADAEEVFARMTAVVAADRTDKLTQMAEYLARASAPSEVGPLPLLVAGGSLSLLSGNTSIQFGEILRSARANDQQIIFIESVDVVDKVREQLALHESSASVA